MMVNRFVLLFCLFLFLFSVPVFSQKPVLTDEEIVIQTVTNEMDALFQSKDFLKQKGKKFPTVSGTIITDIGIIESGKVATFFKVESNIDNPLFTNFISDYIIEYKFNFKLQKKQRYKIRYTVTF